MKLKITLIVLMFLSLIVLKQSLKLYNSHLEAVLALKRLEIENYTLDIENPRERDLLKPCDTSSTKSYMDYRKITNQSSKQWQFIQEHMESRNGILVDRESYIGAALGRAFGEVGDRWIFHLENGETLYMVKVEWKDDAHVIDGCRHKDDGSVIEFVVDESDIPLEWFGSNGLVFNGNFNNYEYFNGNIEYIQKGR